ncbi:hypothetical protein [Geodermatophilus sp. DSM 44513]|uniref:hypothetical protein n=1 Tax=Geodermatophilus sp. DSM 44513 TaxID=1528104 RepID=UPI001412C2F7|nr:hypothetical protein [Geodermatophilus sp. DSM 44513]WNV74252.1 hypothetical protein RTG05_14770 [Geodermatophilus sp. DSM 44513]
MTRSRAAVPAVAALAASLPVALALGGCARDLEAEVHDLLQQRVDAVHASVLDTRARDPRPTGQAAAQALDPYGDALRTTVEGDDVVLVRAVGAAVSELRGWKPTETSASLGACVEVTVRAGDGGEDPGSVTTGPVPCPAGAEVLGDDGRPVEALTTDLAGRSDDVGAPPYDPPVCLSGEPCTEGGG